MDDKVIEAWRIERLNSEGQEMPSAARVVLEEFGGLVITPTGRGIDFARMDLSFDGEGDGGEYHRRTVVAIGVGELYPLGSYGDGFGTFLIDGTGAVWVDYEVNAPAGKTIDQALVRLLLGIKW